MTHTTKCKCDGRGIVPGPIGGSAVKCDGAPMNGRSETVPLDPDEPDIREAVERSSFGTPEAQELTHYVDDETAERITRRAQELDREAKGD